MTFPRHQLFAMLLTSCLAGCEQHAPTPSPPRPALVMTVGAPSAAALSVLIGEIRPRYESAQSFRIGGKIVARSVEVGSMVKKGQLLARLDAGDNQLAVQAAQAQLRAAEADLALAQAELARYQQLFQRHFIAASVLDVQQAQYDAAAARVKQQRAQLDVSSNQSQYTQLLAERDGVITAIDAEPGQVVSAGQIIAKLAVADNLEVAIAVPESQRAGMDVGSEAEIRLWVNPDQIFHGRVREMAPSADSNTRTFAVRVAFRDAPPNLPMGMTAGVRFYHLNQNDLLLPLAAVSQYNGQTVAWRVDGNHQVQPQPVVVGVYREDGVSISQGLQAGEQVVIAGVHALIPGQTVRPQPVSISR